MKAVVNFHPVLTEEDILKIGYQATDYAFEYDKGKDIFPLKAEPVAGQEHIQSQLHLTDEEDEWDSRTYNLRVKRTIIIRNPMPLFGPNGVAGSNAEIGVAVIWASKPSKQRGVFTGDSFTRTNFKTEYTVAGEFPKGILRDRLTLKTILYLKNPGITLNSENHLNQTPGAVLGELGETTIYLSGIGSVFPIFIQKESGPLWRVECKWGDPRTDEFDDENIRIILNESHSDYKLIDPGNKKSLSPLLKEIIASAVSIIIERVKETVSVGDILASKDIEEGSICMAVRYFIETFSLDTSSPESLAYSMRAYLDQKIGGIT